MVKLFDEQLIPRSDLETADANLGVADGRYQEAIETARTRQALLSQRRSELAIAQQQLADSVLTAPFDGAVRERLVNAGDYLTAGAPVAVVVRVDPLRLRLAVPEREATGIRVGQPVELTVEGVTDRHTGRVARISPSISESNRTLMVEAEVPNGDHGLRPGGFARARIVVQAGVVFAFMRSWRSTVIAAVAIPTSVIATFGMMKALNFTLNSVTMLALVLMVGVVIDDAIVILENIFRFIEEKKMGPFEAAREATREIGLAVLATTLSLVVIFVPVSFMSSVSGRFLYQFGLTAAAAVLVSLLVSFTLTPMMNARMLRAGDAASGHGEARSRQGFYARLDRGYERLLRAPWPTGGRRRCSASASCSPRSRCSSWSRWNTSRATSTSRSSRSTSAARRG
jgi:hypothetical protein